MKSRLVIDHHYDFDSQPYLPIAKRKQSGFVEVAYQDVLLRWPDDEDVKRIARWLKDEDIYKPLGFSRSIPKKYIRRSVVPDLTGTMEAVEFLVVQHAPNAHPIGFLICYEARKRGDANQEVDFALAETAFRGRIGLVRAIKVALLTYLFAMCHAETVHWIRRKRSPLEGKEARYVQQGAPIIVDRDRFAAMLQTLERTHDRHDLPIIVLAANRHRVSRT